MKKIVNLLFVLFFLTSCGAKKTAEEKMLDKLGDLVENADDTNKDLEKIGRKIAENVDKEDLKKLSDGLGQLSKELSKKQNKDDKSAKAEQLPYQPDALWEKAVANFEKGLVKMPTKGLRRETVGRKMGDKGGTTEVIIWGKFLYKDSVMAILPRKVSNKGVVKEVENYDKIANTKARDLKTKDWYSNYALDATCPMVLLQKKYQDQIGLVPTGDTETIDGIEAKVYKASYIGRKGEPIQGKVYVDATKGMAVKVDFMLKKGGASGGVIYTLGVDADGLNVVKSNTIIIELNMLGLAQSTRESTLEFSEYGQVEVE